MKRYEDLTLTDDFMFSKVMLNKELCKELIEILLDVKVEKIEYISRENTIKEDPIGRGIRLDVYVKDSTRVFDIEIQTTNKHDLPKRSRYYQALMDIDNLSTGATFNDLKESYIVFICTFDPFGRGLAKYMFTECSVEINDLYLDDKTFKVFYNTTAYENSTNKRIQDFLQYLTTTNAKSEFTQKLDRAVSKIKGHQDWRKEYMFLSMKFNEFLEDGRQQGIEQGIGQGIEQGIQQGIQQGINKGREQGLEKGRKEGRDETKIETAKIALQNNIPIEMIVKLTQLPYDRIQKLSENL